jgi:hypothetical protein
VTSFPTSESYHPPTSEGTGSFLAVDFIALRN